MRSFRAGLLIGVALTVGCTGDDATTTTASSVQQPTSTTEEPVATSTSVATSTTSTVVGFDRCPSAPAGSSPAEFDPAAGTYSAQGVTLDLATGSLEFNVVQWLTGDDARKVWLEDNPDDPYGPPNDYYIVDASDRVRTAPVDSDAAVYLVHLDDGTTAVEADSLDGLAQYLDGGDPVYTYWLTFDDGVVTEICEQYRP
jgi:hypothetical protein